MNTNIFKENLLVAWRSVITQKVRAILTGSIIAIGITALVGILTAIDSLERSINEEFTLMGSNTFKIRSKGSRFKSGGKGAKVYPNISYFQALNFKERMEEKNITSISVNTGYTAILKYGSAKTNPNITITGADENYLPVAGFEIEAGRSFSAQDVKDGRSFAIVGKEIKEKLFGNSDPVGKVISISGKTFLIIGVLKEKGSSAGFGGDRVCIVPLNTARAMFLTDNPRFEVAVMANSVPDMDNAIAAATGIMRSVRKDPRGKPESFEIRRSDNLVNILLENLKYVSVAATAIGMITLLGAAIGLMNIMLVSVTERTREIGTRKALGAKAIYIRQQFLIEAILVCLFGGIAGIFLGIGIGNITALLIGGSFFIPWLWIALGLTLCLLTGVVAGFYPANKAAKLDPIEALRYE